MTQASSPPLQTPVEAALPRAWAALRAWTTPALDRLQQSPSAVWTASGLLGAAGLALALATGGWRGLVGALLLASAGALLARRPGGEASAQASAQSSSSAPAEREGQAQAAAATAAVSGATACQGADVMVVQIVPVWERQLLASRELAEQGLAKLLEAFAGVSSAADEIASRLADVASGGGIDAAQLSEHPALQALQAVSARAFAERDAAVAVLAQCAGRLDELQQQVKLVRELARHTRLVAFNASIEAQRAGQAGGGAGAAERGGSQAVSVEVRTLAARMAESAEQLDRIASSMLREVAQARRDGEIHSTSGEELRLESELRAREALQALGGTLGQSLAGSGALSGVGEQLGAQIAEAFMHFQFGDRISQMQAILANDMAQLVQWVKLHPVATRQDAADWLEALEASYTMEEQRSQHHGNVHVDRSAGAEFF